MKTEIPVSFGQHQHSIVTIETDADGKIINESCNCKEYARHNLCFCILRAHDIFNGEWPPPPTTHKELCSKDWEYCTCRKCEIERLNQSQAEFETPKYQSKIAHMFSTVIHAIYGVGIK